MFTVEVVSPESVSYTGEAEMVVARTVDGGDIAFQTGHVPFIGTLAVWSVDVIKDDGDRDSFAVHRGFVQVSGDQVRKSSAHSGMSGIISRSITASLKWLR